MKILYLSEDHSPANFGVTSVLSSLVNQLSAHHPEIHIALAATSDSSVPHPAQVKINLFPLARWGKAWRWSPNLLQNIKKLVQKTQPDLIHIHGIWYAIPWAGMLSAQDFRIPALVTVHGMWEPYFWQEQGHIKRWKYQVYFHLFLRRLMSQKVAMHAITALEKTSIQALLPANPITTIPNAIQVESNPPPPADLQKRLLFLGRLHPKKGVELILRAFQRANLPPEWRVAIAGPEQIPSYVAALKAETAQLDLTDRVDFLGPVYGEQKDHLLRTSWAMLTPSYSETIGMVNLEAAAQALPSVTTHPTGLDDWENGGGLLIHPTVDELTASLHTLSAWSLPERRERGQKSHQHVLQTYSWQAVLPRWLALYRQLSTHG